MPSPDFKLYVITDRLSLKNKTLQKAVQESLEGGAKAIQLREKDLSTLELFEYGEELRALTRKYKAKLIINDRCDVALALRADGVQLTTKSFSPKRARELLGEDMLIGVSTHSLEEALIAEKEGADFITLGPVYDTPSKAKYGEAIGVAILKDVASKIGIPVFALGGIQVKGRMRSLMRELLALP